MSPATLDTGDAVRLEDCLRRGGVAVFPTDTVYGIGCDPDSARAVARVYELKGRPAERPAAVLFFALAPALSALPELTGRERLALGALLPGPVTLLLPNRARRFALACGPDPDTLGLRVPALAPALAALGALREPVLQSSANLTGEREARRLADVPRELRDGVELCLDGGELPGVASTVIDLREYGDGGRWSVVRAGARSSEAVRAALATAHEDR
ncbi:MAG TPA: Sua5/YciO/YrdC/YwlC family protein [Solirubrobacteraceae bacterium]|nr:Sua5/YciO/YrdC/YwlC family protein [Solirubrobacteraceae bacterium]